MKHIGKVSDSNDLTVLKNEILIELRNDLRQAEYIKNWKRATFLKKQIEQIENIKS